MTLAEDAVESPGGETLKIEGAEGEPGFTADRNDLLAQHYRTGDLRLGHLHEGDLAVMSNTKIGEPKGPKSCLSAFD